MSRSFAVSLGALAMALVVSRGLWRGESADSVAVQAMQAMAVFVCVGGVAGWIADYLVRDAIERTDRDRVECFQRDSGPPARAKIDSPEAW